ncbi:VOC family protein [Mucilaginibacter achroorhodeus]|uniref:VOC family protein n=1 Tax=Mucilaginibacter achroorhodeus TaxID=2599294 RepID=A0A563UBH9_9SPHI|nr:VOC family protein [Mucilaginibacter achroorhodeus]TWR28609.1 VOC family protein [Mucilaginibacter achroorhodeus]
MIKLSSYINFNNNATEAMTFYHQVLGGKLSLMKVKDSPMKDMFPAEQQDIILHADLTGDDFTIQGTDMPDSDVQAFVGAVSISLTLASVAEVHDKFEKLREGGKAKHEVMSFFAGTMGNVTDKYGVRWNIFTPEK